MQFREPYLSRRAALAMLGAAGLSVASKARSAPAATGLVSVTGAKLFYQDSGGTGAPLIMLHAFTGSAFSWDAYQRTAFTKAGLRVISYSRRGFRGSEVEPGSPAGSAIDDLDAVADSVGVKRFHLLGTAGGGFILPDYALSRPERVRSMIMACTQGGCIEPSFVAALDRMLPAEFKKMPPAFRELAPAYRALNPEGTAAWEAMERTSKVTERIVQAPRNRIDFAALSRIRVPTLVIAGDADLYIPPALARQYAAQIPKSEFAVIQESGHSAFWEQPAQFNRLVGNFVRRF